MQTVQPFGTTIWPSRIKLRFVSNCFVPNYLPYQLVYAFQLTPERQESVFCLGQKQRTPNATETMNPALSVRQDSYSRRTRRTVTQFFRKDTSILSQIYSSDIRSADFHSRNISRTKKILVTRMWLQIRPSLWKPMSILKEKYYSHPTGAVHK